MTSHYFDAIRAHIEQHLGAIAQVWNQDDLDILVVAPSEARPFQTWITAGLSDHPMEAPKAEWTRAELCFLLPPHWSLERDSWGEGERWPLQWLNYLARMPRLQNTWLGYGHTIPNGEPPQPLDDSTDACSVMLIPPVSLPERFARLRVDESESGIINFWALVPLMIDELDLKLEKGTPVLLERMQKAKLSDIWEPGRRSVLARRGLARWALGE